MHGGPKPIDIDSASLSSSLGGLDLGLDSPNLVARLSWLDSLGGPWHAASRPLDVALARPQSGITAHVVQLDASHTAATSQPLATPTEHTTRQQSVCGARYAEGMPYLERGEQARHSCVGDEAGQPASFLLGRPVGPNHVAARFDQGGGYSRVLPAHLTPGCSVGEPPSQPVQLGSPPLANPWEHPWVVEVSKYPWQSGPELGAEVRGYPV